MNFRTLLSCKPLLVLASLVTSSSFAADTPDKVNFEDHVKPIFRQHCVNCHHQGEKKGGLALDTFGSVVEGGGSGEIVFDDGDAEGSRLWQLVNHDDTPVMPPNQDKLPEQQLAIIRAWIEGGILENSGSKAKKKKTNALAYVASSGGKPEGPAAMPETMPLRTPVVTDRSAAVTAIATSPWAPVVAIAGQKQIVFYHTETSELLGIIPFEEGVAQDLRFSRDGAYLIVGGGEHSFKGVVAIFDVKTGNRLATVGDELDTVFGADADGSLQRVALGGPQKMLRIFDAGSGEKLFDLKKHTDWIFSVAYSPDGVLIASGDRAGGLCVWEAETGRLYLDLTGHKGAVLDVAWRDDSNVLASASADGSVKLWDMHQGKAIRSINAHGGGVTSVQFDHQGRLVTAGADERAKMWDAAGKKLKEFKQGTEDMLEVAITHDGKRMIYGNWAGDVFSTPVDKPDATVTLAANPESPEKLIEATKTTLVSAQQRLAPAKAKLDAALNAVSAAEAPIKQLEKNVARLKSEAEKSEAAAVAAAQSVTKIDGELAASTGAVRDLQDEVTAVRVALKSDASKLLAVADAEERLAAKLSGLAKRRRLRVSTEASIAQHRKVAAEKTAELKKLAASKPELDKKLQVAKSAADIAKKEFDAVSASVKEIQSKMDRLLADN